MLRRIVAFELDDEQHWRALLVCGHYQHVRHDPPLISRPWVLTEAGRESRIGMSLDCLLCDEAVPAHEKKTGQHLSGLVSDGGREVHRKQ